MTKRFLKAVILGGLVLALFLGGCNNPAGGGNAAQEAADNFKSGQSGVLDKTADTVGLGDEAAVDAALTAYAALSAEAKELLTAEKAKLDALKAKIAELKAAATAEELAEAFRTGHATVLGKTADTVALGDEAAVNAALSAYGKLSDGAKALLTAEKSKLDSLKTKIAELRAAITFSTVEGLQTYLTDKDSNDTDTPYSVIYTGNETPEEIYAALEAGGKFVSLDLSGSSVTGFAKGAEAGRAKIVHLILPDSLTVLPNATSSTQRPFINYTNLKTVRANRLQTLGNYGFSSLASLTAVSLPEATAIGNLAFSACTNLVTVDLPRAATFGTSAFTSSGLVTLHLPAATSFGDSVFYNNTAITTVILGSTPPAFGTTPFSRAAATARTITIKVPVGKLAGYQAATIAEGKTWADVTNKPNSAAEGDSAGEFWDSYAGTKANLTVNLVELAP
jgi:hypothetical protein